MSLYKEKSIHWFLVSWWRPASVRYHYNDPLYLLTHTKRHISGQYLADLSLLWRHMSLRRHMFKPVYMLKAVLLYIKVPKADLGNPAAYFEARRWLWWWWETAPSPTHKKAHGSIWLADIYIFQHHSINRSLAQPSLLRQVPLCLFSSWTGPSTTPSHPTDHIHSTDLTFTGPSPNTLQH